MREHATSQGRLPILDMMRGVAAFAVCWYHVTHGNISFLPPGVLRSSGNYGWLGVEVFFVISGFVIPYALNRSGYRLRDYRTFLVKRIVRLDPPYLVTIVMILVLNILSTLTPGFRGDPFHFSWTQTLLHLGYLNTFFDYPWLNPVFWTLAIEFQYYIFIALLFPLLSARNVWIRSMMALSFIGLALLLPAQQFIFHWLILFLLGIATFQFKTGLVNKPVYLVHVVPLGLVACLYYGVAIGIAGTLSALTIGFVKTKEFGRIGWLGTISYSLYLLHAPIGGRVINLSSHFALTFPQKGIAVLIAVATSICAAFLLHRFVEHPAQRWSARIPYRSRTVAPTGFATRERGVAAPAPVKRRASTDIG